MLVPVYSVSTASPHSSGESRIVIVKTTCIPCIILLARRVDLSAHGIISYP